MPPLTYTAEADEVVGSESPRHPASHGRQPNHRQLAQTSHRLDPAKTLFDTLAALLAHRIALAACCPPIDGAASTFGVASDVPLDAAHRKRRYKVLCVVPFIRAQRGTVFYLSLRQQRQGTLAFACPAGMAYIHGHDEAVAVLHQGVRQIAQPRLFACALARKS